VYLFIAKGLFTKNEGFFSFFGYLLLYFWYNVKDSSLKENSLKDSNRVNNLKDSNRVNNLKESDLKQP